MLAACHGGNTLYKTLPKHEKICDVYKNILLQDEKLPINCYGYLINPVDMPVFPNLFWFNPENGNMQAHEKNCATYQFQVNVYESTAELVRKTIEILNLNCLWLRKNRLAVYEMLQNEISKIMISNGDISELIDKCLDKAVFGYFTTCRQLLGKKAEEYLAEKYLTKRDK